MSKHRSVIAAALLSLPLVALAQYVAPEGVPGAPPAAVSTGNGILTLILKALALPLLGLLVSLVREALARFKGDSALGKVAELLDVIGSRVWDRIGAELQAALADGKVTEEEKRHLVTVIEGILPSLVSADTINAAMKALGVPTLSGLAGWILAKLMPRAAGANDPSDTSVPGGVAAIYRPVEVAAANLGR